MASKKRNVKARAKINLKYDKDAIKIGQEFKVRAEDAAMMVANGYIDLLYEMPKEDEEDSGEGAKEGEE